MTLNRRQALAGGAALVVTAWAGPRRAAGGDSPAVAALGRSRLIYLTPIVAGGRESACHGEVWFVQHRDDVFVVTQAGAWRAEAVRRGMTRAKVWIGEFGPWTGAGDRFRSAPYLELEGRLETDPAVQAEVLSIFGRKYESEWGSWGPRFTSQLAEGTRVMLRYQVAS